MPSMFSYPGIVGACRTGIGPISHSMEGGGRTFRVEGLVRGSLSGRQLDKIWRQKESRGISLGEECATQEGKGCLESSYVRIEKYAREGLDTGMFKSLIFDLRILSGNSVTGNRLTFSL